MPLLEDPRHAALAWDIVGATRSGYRPDRRPNHFIKQFRFLIEGNPGDWLRRDVPERPRGAPIAPDGLPRTALTPPMNRPWISHRPPSNLPGAALATPRFGKLSSTASTIVNGGARYPAPRASDSFSVSRSSQASSAAASSARAASRAVEVRAKAAGSRP
jgi:hypothetical protein